MRKWIAIFLAILLISSLAACRSTGESAQEPGEQGDTRLNPSADEEQDAQADGEGAEQGEQGEQDETQEDAPQPQLSRTALTAEEIDWFNTSFFNGEDFNLHNQFVIPLYDIPEDIDLYEVFYNGTGYDEALEEQELQELLSRAGFEEPPTDCLKNSRENLDRALEENLGLSLAETYGVGLNQWAYLPHYDAYYLWRGDTNYQPVEILSGYIESSGYVYLEYNYLTWEETQRVLCLEKTGEESYRFVSNRLAE